MTTEEIEKTRLLERQIWAAALQLPSAKGKPLLALFSLLAVVCRAAFKALLKPEWLIETVVQLWEEWCGDNLSNGNEQD